VVWQPRDVDVVSLAEQHVTERIELVRRVGEPVQQEHGDRRATAVRQENRSRDVNDGRRFVPLSLSDDGDARVIVELWPRMSREIAGSNWNEGDQPERDDEHRRGRAAWRPRYAPRYTGRDATHSAIMNHIGTDASA